MEPYNHKFTIGEVLYLKKGQELEDAFTKLSGPAAYNIYWVPHQRTCSELADTKMTVVAHYFWHGGFPICVLDFTKDGIEYQTRICEEFLCRKRLKNCRDHIDTSCQPAPQRVFNN